MKQHGSQILKRFQGKMGSEKRSPQVIESIYCELESRRIITRYQGPPERPQWRTVPVGAYSPLLED